MCLELLVLVWVTFKRRTGLYFWCIVATTIGLVLQTTGYLLKSFENSCPVVLVTIICKVGWVSNVTGFSLVLWSRLHLVVRSPTVLRFVLALILIDAVVLHTPIVVFEFGLLTNHRERYLRPMEVMERIQQTVFTLQETLISSLYIYHTARFLSAGYAIQTRRVVGLLIAVQALVISLDAGLTAFDYMNMFTLKCTVHPFVYAVKLRLEFIVLNQLLAIVKRGLAPDLRMSRVSRLDFVNGFPSSGGGAGAGNLPVGSGIHDGSLRPGPSMPKSSSTDDEQATSTGRGPSNISVDFITRAPAADPTPPDSPASRPAKSPTAVPPAVVVSGLDQPSSASSPDLEKQDAAAAAKIKVTQEISVRSSSGNSSSQGRSEKAGRDSVEDEGASCSGGEETDLREVVGETDEYDEAPDAVEHDRRGEGDVERRYLGRFGMS